MGVRAIDDTHHMRGENTNMNIPKTVWNITVMEICIPFQNPVYIYIDEPLETVWTFIPMKFLVYIYID